MEARGFRELYDDIRRLGAEVVGVSADRPEAQRRFAERLDLPFPMLCNPEGEVLRAYGVRNPLGYARRATFLIGPDGTVAKVYPKVRPADHPGEVLEDLKVLGAARSG